MSALSTRPERRPTSVRAFAERVRAARDTDKTPERNTQPVSTVPPPAASTTKDDVARGPTVALSTSAGESAAHAHVKDAVTARREQVTRSPMLVVAAALVVALGLAFVRRGWQAPSPPIREALAQSAEQERESPAADPTEAIRVAPAPTSSAEPAPAAISHAPTTRRPRGPVSGSPEPVTAPATPAASELPGGVYEKPPY
jgi:hypothetical protein